MQRFFQPVSALLLSTLALASPAAAQLVGGRWETVHRFEGGLSGLQMGWSVAGAGDVDGDGFDDLIVGAPNTTVNGLAYAGSAFVYSGATGGMLHRFDGAVDFGSVGWSVAGAGDVDRDGFADVILGVPAADPGLIYGAGSAVVHSGATGALLWRFDGSDYGDYCGWSVAGAGDVDGDGFDDLIVGAERADPGGRSNAGSAYVYSGATGALLWQFDGASPVDSLGGAVAGAGDVDRDGRADLIVGARWASPGGVYGAGSAFVYSGATGAILHRFDGTLTRDHLGRSVAGAGDVDGDGLDDVLVGMPQTPATGPGLATVYSGATGAPIWQFTNGTGHLYGLSVDGAGDVDGDGCPDLIVGAPKVRLGGLIPRGSAYLYSGATGALLHRFDGVAQWDEYGRSVAGAGDVDRDGHADVIVGASYAETAGGLRAGCAYVHALDPFLRPSAREISASSGVPVTFAVDFPASEAGQAYLLLASRAGTGPTTLGGVEVPLTADALLARLLAGWTPPLVTGAYGVLDPNGDGTATLASGPALAAYVGQSVYLAALSFAPPAGARLSSIARVLTVVP